jgi:murein DD-endopeptidase MepM/ murein hydrolase activator NlpD
VRWSAVSILLVASLSTSVLAFTVQDGRTAAFVSEQSCVAPKLVSVFQPVDRQAFVWFVALHVRSGDQLRVEWLDPYGAVSTTADYGQLPTAGELCFTAQLPIAGFAPASQPGNWTVRAVSKGTVAFSRTFTIAPNTDNGGPVIISVTWPGVGPGQPAQGIDFTVRGKNFQPGSLVLMAEYKPAGGWIYLASLQARDATADQLTVHYAGLPANEYLVIVENPDQRMSRPMPFLISTGGYKLPTAAGVPWIVTQGPYGTFSHWGNSLHAFDIAPRAGSCVVAMKAGIAYAHDLGLGQDHRHRSFGNYVTIEHGNGEFSHYAHLATGTFVVKNGERVEQGQALATAGNSGYTLGEGGGYHVHVSVTRALPISSSSVPFQFEDLPDWTRGSGYRTVVSSNTSPLCDCGSRRTIAGGGERGRVATASSSEGQFSGTVSVEQWWSEVIAVAGGSKVLEVTLSWAGAPGDLDLHLMSPSARHYAAYADTTGYSGESNPKSFRVPNPEAGLWRISVEGMRGPGPINFGVDTAGAQQGRGRLRAAR